MDNDHRDHKNMSHMFNLSNLLDELNTSAFKLCRKILGMLLLWKILNKSRASYSTEHWQHTDRQTDRQTQHNRLTNLSGRTPSTLLVKVPVTKSRYRFIGNYNDQRHNDQSLQHTALIYIITTNSKVPSPASFPSLVINCPCLPYFMHFSTLSRSSTTITMRSS